MQPAGRGVVAFPAMPARPSPGTASSCARGPGTAPPAGQAGAASTGAAPPPARASGPGGSPGPVVRPLLPQLPRATLPSRTTGSSGLNQQGPSNHPLPPPSTQAEDSARRGLRSAGRVRPRSRRRAARRGSSSSIRSPSSQRQTCGIGISSFHVGTGVGSVSRGPLVLGCPAARRPAGWQSNTAPYRVGRRFGDGARSRPKVGTWSSPASRSRSHAPDRCRSRRLWCATPRCRGWPRDPAPGWRRAKRSPGHPARWPSGNGGSVRRAASRTPQPNGGCSRPPPGSLPPTLP